MKKLILLAGVATLAACAEEAADDTMTEEVVEEAAVEAEGPGMAGTYTIYDAEGTNTGATTLNADGSYSYASADGSETGEGTWANVDGTLCLDGTEAEGEEDTGPTCWTQGGEGEDGRMMWTSDEEEPATSYTTHEAA